MFLVNHPSQKFEFVQQLHVDKRNIVIGLVESKKDVEQLFPNSRNIKLVEANVADSKSLMVSRSLCIFSMILTTC